MKMIRRNITIPMLSKCMWLNLMRLRNFSMPFQINWKKSIRRGFYLTFSYKNAVYVNVKWRNELLLLNTTFVALLMHIYNTHWKWSMRGTAMKFKSHELLIDSKLLYLPILSCKKMMYQYFGSLLTDTKILKD